MKNCVVVFVLNSLFGECRFVGDAAISVVNIQMVAGDKCANALPCILL
jgi:hypothetical protein